MARCYFIEYSSSTRTDYVYKNMFNLKRNANVRYNFLCSVFLISDLILDSSLFCHCKLTHTTLNFRCDLGSCGRDVASCCLPNPSRYCHGDCFSRRHPDEDAEDVDPATHHLQFNHRCSVNAHSQLMHHII